MITSLKQSVYDLMYPAKTLYNATCICNSTFISMGNYKTAEDARKHMVSHLIGMGIDEEDANKVLEHDNYSTPNFSVEIEPYTQRELAVWYPPLELLIQCFLAITIIIVGCRVIF